MGRKHTGRKLSERGRMKQTMKKSGAQRTEKKRQREKRRFLLTLRGAGLNEFEALPGLSFWVLGTQSLLWQAWDRHTVIGSSPQPHAVFPVSWLRKLRILLMTDVQGYTTGRMPRQD